MFFYFLSDWKRAVFVIWQVAASCFRRLVILSQNFLVAVSAELVILRLEKTMGAVS